jgi:hypothetical protein
MSNENLDVTGKTGRSEKRFQDESTSDFLEIYKIIIGTNSPVIKHAADVMESEIATILRVAKQIEESSVSSNPLPPEKPEELLQRFRRDAHALVDIWANALSASIIPMNETTKSLYAPNTCAPKKPVVADLVPATKESADIAVPQCVKAGGLAEFPIAFENAGAISTDEFSLYSTDLVGDNGERISSSLVKFMPSSLKLEPHQNEKVMVIVAVPRETKPSVYTGLVLAANMNQLQSEIKIKVE